jgi:enamine deaminase RidA (YjgF/YER057c/UK114 family)
MKTVNPAGWAPPKGYSNGVVADGPMLFVAGQVGWDEQGRIVSDAIGDQFDRALANVIAVVAAAGGTAESIVRLTIFVVDIPQYSAARREIGERYRSRMGSHYPAMTLVQVAALLEPGALVEIEGTAVLERQR